MPCRASTLFLQLDDRQLAFDAVGDEFDLLALFAMVEDYVIEGHVSAAEVERLLSGRPDMVGLSVPGIVMETPGMGSREGGDAFDVMLMKRDGTAEVFSSYAEG